MFIDIFSLTHFIPWPHDFQEDLPAKFTIHRNSFMKFSVPKFDQFSVKIRLTGHSGITSNFLVQIHLDLRIQSKFSQISNISAENQPTGLTGSL